MSNINSATPAMAVVADDRSRPGPGRKVQFLPVPIVGLDDWNRRIADRRAA